MNVNEELQRLRTEEPRPEAKGELILKLKRKEDRKSMKLIKLGIPTALVASAIVAGTLMLPKTALASPESVANALRQAREYVIKSFSVNGSERTLMTSTQVKDGKKMRTSYDKSGKALPPSEVKDPITTLTDGKMHELTFGDPNQKGTGRIRMSVGGESAPPASGNSKRIEIRNEKGADGKLTKKYIVDGKEVDKLPAGVSERVHVGPGKGGALTIHNGEVGAGIDREARLEVKGQGGGHTNVVAMNSNGQLSTFVSGQTAADYLLKMLEDEGRWVIERGVLVNGVKLDKFTLKGGFSPIELFVDPGNSLPRILRFNRMGEKGTMIEDVYEYGVQPN